jgi:hypothetical protein
LLCFNYHMNIFEWIANSKIEEAIKRGEFDNLPGMGKPLNLDDDYGVPEHLRLTYRIMKNAGVAPPEVSLRKELESLRAELTRAQTEEKRKALESEIRWMCLRIAMLSKER